MPAPAPDPPEVEQLLAGGPTAAGDLIARHLPLIRQTVEFRMDRLLRARVDPEDVAQEAALRIAGRLSDYLARRPMPFHLWARRTAQEALIDVRRQHVEAGCRAAGNEVPLPDQSSFQLAHHLAAAAPPASKLARAAEAADLVRGAIAALDEADREVILLRNYEGLSNADAAAVLGLDISAASKRYARALLKLRQLLNADDLTRS
ncbi:MAG: sigma-70 family RNA polymerase sigma factor [Gemmataceae bacterium]|nr:sigma-70 family RNA polymerase sigma factor [Gemmataceae bacterium]